jgi:UDP-3-O-[3-hydroxymyristoyl] N-acetylglucosamine deacetylase
VPAHLTGRGLHTGLPAAVTLARIEGPVVFRGIGGAARLEELAVVRADLGVRVASDRAGVDVDSVEHLLSALGGLRVHAGIAIETSDPELPLLDGAALAFAEAIVGLGLEPSRATPELRVAREGVVRVGASEYAFTPADDVALFVKVDFHAAGIGVQTASWDGTRESYLRDVAPARTFGFRRDAAALERAGRARGVDAAVVMVLDDHGAVEPPGPPARPSEFARHKLLDLIGDLYLFGGPPLGHVRAERPGHAATHRAIAEAVERRIVVRART